MKKHTGLYEQLQHFEDEIGHLEGKILALEEKLNRMIQVERDHLIRVKNKEELSDEFIAQGKSYQDLTPEKAWKFYQKEDFNFILIDVSSKDFRPLKRIPEALHLPWEDFRDRFIELQSRTTPIFVICEDGTHSVLACEFLVKHGFFNCNNISGGYKHWKGFQFSDVNDQSA
jgi:rhodanese-related sulfurtransferase